MGSQQVFISFANLYKCFIQDFSSIAISPTAILKTTGLSVASASRIDDDEIVGSSGGAKAETSGNAVKQKLGSIVRSTRSMRKVFTHLVNLRELA